MESFTCTSVLNNSSDTSTENTVINFYGTKLFESGAEGGKTWENINSADMIKEENSVDSDKTAVTKGFPWSAIIDKKPQVIRDPYKRTGRETSGVSRYS